MEIIGIMGAMPDEVEQLCALLDGVSIEPYAGVEYHRGMLGDKQVVVCCAGMGKANAAATTQVLITKFGAQRIIFSGIAGNMTAKIGIGDVVVGKTVVYHDAQDDMIAQSAPFTAEYPGDEELGQGRHGRLRRGGREGHRGQDRHRRPIRGRQRHQERHRRQGGPGLCGDGGCGRVPDRCQE